MPHSQSPNVLFLHTDQQRYSALGCAGNDVIDTPNLDRLAEDGVRFSDAYVQSPVCMPSRASYMTGRYPSELAIFNNGSPLPQTVRTLPGYVGNRGYTTANIGKLHFLNHSSRDHTHPHPPYGFDHLEISDEPGCYPDAYRAWVKKHAPERLDDVDLDRIAGRTHGFVGADLASLTTEAAMNALRRDREGPSVTRSDFEGAMATVDPSAMRAYVAETPRVTFEDVGGLTDQKQTLEEIVQWPLAYAPLFEAAATDPPTGVLLHGPPGTGKTLLARAIAGESGVNFIHVNGPEIMDRYVGESEATVRELFTRARHVAPSIVFLDEIDAIAESRGDAHEVTERVVSQLLTEIDRAADDPSVVVLAATNRYDSLDDALLRPGRLEEHLLVPAPDEDGRRAIFAVHTDGKPIADDVDLDDLAARTEGFSGAEIAAVVRAASMRAIRSVATEIEPDEAAGAADDVIVSAADFDVAFDRVDSQRRL
jgi:SpoVK/Ycf46/Vps4 family AAA+-type ATPase